MKSRKVILEKIKANKPSLNTHIDLSPFYQDNEDDIVLGFGKSLEENGGRLFFLNKGDSLQDLILQEINNTPYLDLSGTMAPEANASMGDDPKNMNNIKTAIFKVDLGVAENGAIWVDDSHLGSLRALPFIVEHGIFILPKSGIVPTMHHAYQELGTPSTGFGTFIAGPSKTGDIEQNLVVGAHGPLSHLVILT